MFGRILLAAVPAAIVACPAAAQPGPAPAQQSAAQTGINAGTRIVDTKGGDVGTVTRVDGQFVVLRTDKHEARLPAAAFTPHEGKLIMAMTRDELNAEIEKTMASAAEKLVEGASVTGSQGSLIGTIQKLEDDFVTLKLTSGALVRLPRSGIGAGAKGVIIGMTAEELKAAAAAAGAKSQ